MANEDPFGRPDIERTIIVPVPGGRSRAQPASRPPDYRATTFDAATPTADSTSGLNPLVAAANPLLRLVPQLRTSASHPDPAALLEQLVAALRTFEEQARARGVEAHKIRGATYALATVLDETIASTPWGSSGAWAKQTLLVSFHNETWGGEKFFPLLARLAENVAANRDLLELLYACLALGFEGRYRIVDNGRSQLEAVRQRLAELLRKDAGEYERALSPHWQGSAAPKATAWSTAPLWIGLAVGAVLLLGGYLWARYLLSAALDPVYAQIQSIHVSPSADSAATMSDALARRSVAISGAPVSFYTPLTVAMPPSMVTSAPILFSSATCMNRFSHIFSQMTLAPSATHIIAISWACISVGNPG